MIKTTDNRQSQSAMTFNMVKSYILSSLAFFCIFLGSLVYEGTEYSATALIKLKLYSELRNAVERNLDFLSDSLAEIKHWPFGIGGHASEPRPILYSSLIAVRTEKHS